MILVAWFFINSIKTVFSASNFLPTEIALTETEKIFLTVFFSIDLLRIILSPLFLGIYLYKLVRLSSGLVKWTHITFGAFSFFFSPIFIAPMLFLPHVLSQGFVGIIGIIPFLSPFIAYFAVWITFTRHLKNAQKKKVMYFS